MAQSADLDNDAPVHSEHEPTASENESTAIDNEPAVLSNIGNGSKSRQTNEEVSAILHSVLHGWVEAINTRQIHLSNPVYKHMAPDFSTTPRIPWQPELSRPMNLEEYLSLLNRICETVPAYGLRVVDLNTVIHPGTGRADVVMNFEVLGAFGNGISYRSVALVKFRRNREGKWLCFTFEAIDGMEGTESSQ